MSIPPIPDPRDQRIAALEAAVAKAEGERDEALRERDRAEKVTRRTLAALEDVEAERDDLRTQLTARDVAGASLWQAAESLADLVAMLLAGKVVRDVTERLEAAESASATAPAAWRK